MKEKLLAHQFLNNGTCLRSNFKSYSSPKHLNDIHRCKEQYHLSYGPYGWLILSWQWRKNGGFGILARFFHFFEHFYPFFYNKKSLKLIPLFSNLSIQWGRVPGDLPSRGDAKKTVSNWPIMLKISLNMKFHERLQCVLFGPKWYQVYHFLTFNDSMILYYNENLI